MYLGKILSVRSEELRPEEIEDLLHVLTVDQVLDAPLPEPEDDPVLLPVPVREH